MLAEMIVSMLAMSAILLVRAGLGIDKTIVCY